MSSLGSLPKWLHHSQAPRCSPGSLLSHMLLTVAGSSLTHSTTTPAPTKHLLLCCALSLMAQTASLVCTTAATASSQLPSQLTPSYHSPCFPRLNLHAYTSDQVNNAVSIGRCKKKPGPGTQGPSGFSSPFSGCCPLNRSHSSIQVSFPLLEHSIHPHPADRSLFSIQELKVEMWGGQRQQATAGDSKPGQGC